MKFVEPEDGLAASLTGTFLASSEAQGVTLSVCLYVVFVENL